MFRELLKNLMNSVVIQRWKTLAFSSGRPLVWVTAARFSFGWGALSVFQGCLFADAFSCSLGRCWSSYVSSLLALNVCLTSAVFFKLNTSFLCAIVGPLSVYWIGCRRIPRLSWIPRRMNRFRVWVGVRG